MAEVGVVVLGLTAWGAMAHGSDLTADPSPSMTPHTAAPPSPTLPPSTAPPLRSRRRTYLATSPAGLVVRPLPGFITVSIIARTLP